MSSQIFASITALGLVLAAGNAHAQGAPPAQPPRPAPGYAAPGSYAPPPGGYAPPPGYAPQAGYPYSAPPGWYPPPEAYAPYTPMKRRSSAMIGWGTVLVSLSSIGLIAGSAMIAGSTSRSFVCDSFTCNLAPPDSTLNAGGIAAIVLGVVALGGGIPLLIVGSQKVPDNDARSPLPTVRVGAGGGSLVWQL